MHMDHLSASDVLHGEKYLKPFRFTAKTAEKARRGPLPIPLPPLNHSNSTNSRSTNQIPAPAPSHPWGDSGHQHLTDAEKIQVVEYSLNHSIMETVKEYGITRSTIHRWKTLYNRFGPENVKVLTQGVGDNINMNNMNNMNMTQEEGISGIPGTLGTPGIPGIPGIQEEIDINNINNTNNTNTEDNKNILIHTLASAKTPSFFGEKGRVPNIQNGPGNPMRDFSTLNRLPMKNDTSTDQLNLIASMQNIQGVSYAQLIYITEMAILKDGKGDNCRVVLDVSSQTGQECSAKFQEFRVYFAFNQEGYPFKPLVILEQHDFHNSYFQIEVAMKSRAIILSKSDINLWVLICERWLAPIIREHPFGKTLIVHNLIERGTHLDLFKMSTSPELQLFSITPQNHFIFPFNLAPRTLLKRKILKYFYGDNMGDLGDNGKLMESIVEGLYNFDVILTRGCFVQFVNVVMFVNLHLGKCGGAVEAIVNGLFKGDEVKGLIEAREENLIEGEEHIDNME